MRRSGCNVRRLFAPISPLIHRNHSKAFFPELLPWQTSLQWRYDHTVVENMWELFFVELGGPKRFAWLGGSSVLMNEAQGILKSQKNISGTLPGSSKVGGVDCSRVIGGSAQEGTDCMVETWLASKPTTRATFCSESLPCTSYPLARSMSSSSADIDMKPQETILVVLIC